MQNGSNAPRKNSAKVYRDFSDRSRPAEERRAALHRAAALRGQDEVTEAVEVILNREEDPALRASALRTIGIEVGKRHDLIDMAIGLLRDSDRARGRAPGRAASPATEQLSRGHLQPETARISGRLAYCHSMIRKIRCVNRLSKSWRKGKTSIARGGYSRAWRTPRKRWSPRGRPCSCSATTSMPSITPSSEIWCKILPLPKQRRKPFACWRPIPIQGTAHGHSQRIRMSIEGVRNASAAALQSLAPAEFKEQAKQIVLDARGVRRPASHRDQRA